MKDKKLSRQMTQENKEEVKEIFLKPVIKRQKQ